MMPTAEQLTVDNIKLDYSNPRISQWLERWGGVENIDAKAVAIALGDSGDGSFDVLKESIKQNKGIIQPIIVNKVGDTYTVIEGNTRVQIYKDLKKEQKGTDGEKNWETIPAMVHKDLPEHEIHAIRLQAHLVGPRDWDPYSKAKYLYTLSTENALTLNEIVDFCGGKTTEVKKMINAYRDMQEYFVPLLAQGEQIPHKKFSAFMELQNKSVLDAIKYNQYTKEDFAKWVKNDNIDKMANVRMLPQILPNKEATEIFLKENASEAYNLVRNPDLASGLLKDATIEVLANQLEQKLLHIELNELKKISTSEDTASDQKRTALFGLFEVLEETIKDIEKF